MTRAIRTLVLGLVGAVALSSAGTALAAYTTPTLLITDAPLVTTINYTQSASDDATASVKVYVPAGYSVSLSQAAGTTVGTVTAQGTAADLGGALLPLTGTIQARAASGTYLSGGAQRPLATAAAECTGTASHTAFWVLILQAAGQTLELPAYVDEVTTAPTVAFAKATVQFCLPPPDLPANHPSRATFGFKLTQATLKLNSVFTSSGTESRWRATATPWRPMVGQPNTAATVEIQSVVAFPRTVTLRKPAVRAVNGTVTLRIGGAANLPTGAAATLRLYRGAKSPSSASIALTKSGSAYSGTLRIRQTARAQVVFLQARATVAAGTVTCTPTFGLPCLSATRAAVTVRSNTVRIVIPKRK